MLLGETSATGAWGCGNEFFGREAWRFVAVQAHRRYELAN